MKVRCTQDCFAGQFYREGWEGDYDGPEHPCLVPVKDESAPSEQKVEAQNEVQFGADGWPKTEDGKTKKGK